MWRKWRRVTEFLLLAYSGWVMPVDTVRVRLALALLCAWLCACGGAAPRLAPRKMTYAPAGRAERMSKLRTSLLAAVPPALLERVREAEWAVEQIGDGELGPSDFVYRIRLRVPPEDVAGWLAGQRVSGQDWMAPGSPLAWWMTPKQKARAEYAGGIAVAGTPGAVAALPEGWVFVFAATR